MKTIGAHVIEEFRVWLEDEAADITELAYIPDRGPIRDVLDRDGEPTASIEVRVSGHDGRTVTVLHDMGSEDAVQVLADMSESLAILIDHLHTIHAAAGA